MTYNQNTWGVDPDSNYAKTFQSKCNWVQCCPVIPKEEPCPEFACSKGVCDDGVYCPIHKRKHYVDKCKEKNQVAPEFVLLKQRFTTG